MGVFYYKLMGMNGAVGTGGIKMPIIRISKEHWEETWEALTPIGPVHRSNDKDFVYSVSEKHVEALKDKDLPFTLVDGDKDRGKNKKKKWVFPFIEIELPDDAPEPGDPYAAWEYAEKHPEKAAEVVRKCEEAYLQWKKRQSENNGTSNQCQQADSRSE